MNKYNAVNNLSSILDNTRLKPVIYNSVIAMAQFFALHKLKPFSEINIPVSKKKIIVHSVHGTYLSAIYKEGAMALSLRLHGNDVKMLFCNKKISCCCALFTIDHPASKRDCANCIRFSKQFCSLLNIPRLTYQDFCHDYDNFEQLLRLGMDSKDGINEKTIYKGVHIGLHAKTGTDRYFKGKQIVTDEYHKHFVSKLIDASIVVDIAEKVREIENPDIILTSHSCYSEFGPFSEYFKNNGTKVFTWFTGYDQNTVVFDLPKVGENFRRFISSRPSKVMTGQEELELDDFIDRRKKGMGESRFYGFTLSKKDIDLSNDSVVFGLFPNAPWDADPSCNTLFFDSINDWVNETIKFFIKHPEKILLIKTHPSEGLFRSRVTVYDSIKNTFPELPANILVIPPKTAFSVYDLFSQLTVGIVSNSTTGLEMILEKIPVITVGEAHYRGKGFTYDPNSRDEYFSLFEKTSFPLNGGDKSRLYAHYYFIKSFLPFRVFYKRNFLDIGFSFKTFDELREDKEMKHIVECITEDKLFQDW